jgi:hypothetical protein
MVTEHNGLQRYHAQWSTRHNIVPIGMTREEYQFMEPDSECRCPQLSPPDLLSASRSELPDCARQAGRLEPTVVGILYAVISLCGCSLSPCAPLICDCDVESFPFTKGRMNGTLAAMMRLLISAAVHTMRFVASSVLVSLDLIACTKNTDR